MAGQIRQMLEETPEFKGLQKQIEIQMTSDGLRIELLEGDEGTFFDSGSSHVRDSTERLLAAIAKELGALQNPIILEGHTDAQPFSRSGFYTNRELGGSRQPARRIMEAGGPHGHQVVGVRGFADTHLRVADKPPDSRNRRVSIIVCRTIRARWRSDCPRGGAGGADPAAPKATPDKLKASTKPAPAPKPDHSTH
jgi:chemotaxis protein MotB